MGCPATVSYTHLSDMKKPDAITCIEADSFREKIWCLPAADLLGVGRATEKILSGYGIHTIGELAATSDDFLKCRLGKNGLAIKKYANGPVSYTHLEKAEGYLSHQHP